MAASESTTERFKGENLGKLVRHVRYHSNSRYRSLKDQQRQEVDDLSKHPERYFDKSLLTCKD